MSSSIERKGKFIVFEYLDGGDAQTFINKIETEKFSAGSVVTDREPTSGLIGSTMNFLLGDNWDKDIHWRTLTYGFLADRTDHCEKENNGIKAILNSGKTFVCDRYNLSTFAYQLPSQDHFEWYSKLSQHLLEPDLTIFLDYDVNTCVNNVVTNRRPNGASIIKVKNKGDQEKILRDAVEVRERYFKAIRFLNSQGSKETRVVAVDTINRAWREIEHLVDECLHSDS